MPSGHFPNNQNGLMPGNPAPSNTFKKGNQAAKGVNKGLKKPRAGRKSAGVKRLLDEYFEMPVERDKERRNVLDIIFDTFVSAMLNRGPDGCVTPAGVAAGKFLWCMKFGKPVERKEISHAHLHMLTEIQNMAALVEASRRPRKQVQNIAAVNGNGKHGRSE